MSQDHSIFSRVKAAISGLKSDLATVEKSISDEQAELERLRKAPVPLDDIRTLLASVVASRATKGRALLGESLRYLQTHPQEVAGDLRHVEPRVSILTACRPDQAAMLVAGRKRA